MFADQHSLQLLQISVLPLVAVVLWKINIERQRIPRILILGAVVISITAFALGYSAKSLNKNKIVISRFSDDPLGSESRIFRERLDERLSMISSLRVVRYPGSFDSFADIRRNYSHGRNFDAILWGKKDSFVIAMARSDANPIVDLLGLKLSTQIPAINLSRSTDSGTIDFIADLLAAQLDDLNSQARRQILLEDSLKIQSRWRSRSHRAVSSWILGIDALQQSLAHGKFEPAELQCALKHFAFSSNMFFGNRDPQLAAVVYNSWGVALAIEGWMTGDNSALNKAEQQFKRAALTGKPGQLARENLRMLHGKKRIKASRKHRAG